MGHVFPMVGTIGNYLYATCFHYVEVNACVKKLLSCFHGGYLWLGTKLPIIIDLISQISRLPMAGLDPLQYFHGKDNDKILAVKLKKKYNVIRDKQVYVIKTINDKAI